MQLRAAAPDVPIVILSGLQDELLAIKAVQEGAQDYLVKGRVDGAAIGRSITYAVERKALEMQLAHKAMHDALTGLPNRDAVPRPPEARGDAREAPPEPARRDVPRPRRLQADQRQPRPRRRRPAAGRARPAPAGRPARRATPPARFGGDEFMVLCEDVADEQHVISIAERLQARDRRAVRDRRPRAERVRPAWASWSATATRTSAESLIRNADAAMYRAKHQGVAVRGLRRRHAQPRARRVRGPSRDLHRAIEEREFRLLYQPQVDLRSGEIVGLEALLRWDHPERGVVEPAEFLWLAEETGLITRIGEWALRQSCLQARAWGARSGSPLRVTREPLGAPAPRSRPGRPGRARS